MKNIICASLMIFPIGFQYCSAQESSKNNKWLQEALENRPQADRNRDGILTMEEELAFTDGRTSVPTLTLYIPSDEEIRMVIEKGRKKNDTGPLEVEKSNGLRILMMGHSWVAPARKTFSPIARAAGFDGHQLRCHLSGGATGVANSIWKKEFGRYGEKPPEPILLPALATGQWDVLTLGVCYLGDRPEFYSQWIDLCLKYNPEMMFYIQSRWPRANWIKPDFSTLTQEQLLDSLLSQHIQMQAQYSQTIYQPLEGKYPDKVHIIPAGSAVVALIQRFFKKEVPDLDCFDEKADGGKRGIFRDGSHLSLVSGTEWLIGYLYYGMLYRKSPQLIKNFLPEGVPNRLDQTLREIAWKTIIESPYSGIRDRDGNGVAD